MSDFRRAIAPPGTPLTPREQEVIETYRRRGSIIRTAMALEIAESTVAEHLANARSRRGVSRTWQLLVD